MWLVRLRVKDVVDLTYFFTTEDEARHHMAELANEGLPATANYKLELCKLEAIHSTSRGTWA